MALSGIAQESPAPQPTAPQMTLGDAARANRAEKAKPPAQQTGPQKSLAELAAERRAQRKAAVELTEKDVDELLKDLNEITDFASSDTGYAEHSRVKHQIVGKEDVKRSWASSLSGSAEARRLTRSEMVLKKFGYIPQDFTLKKYLVDNAADGIAGFYDFRTKTMNLVNWVSPDKQRPIMAHELTHALQDQNFNLMAWERAGAPRASSNGMQVQSDEAQESDARRAVIEGQAMIVFFDWMLKPYGRTLADTPSAMDFINAKLTETYDTSLVVHDAPLIFKESAIFPYREGLMFELALMKKGGVQQAFAEAFAHPPADTHQILDPDAYFAAVRIPPVIIPDLSEILRPQYESYDSGAIGQLDVRVFSQQFGTDNDMFTITAGWRGGSYVAVKRTLAAKAGTVGTADVSLIYVSRWKDAESAQRFAELYRKSLSKRLSVTNEADMAGKACAPNHCALWATRVNTNEGPVFIEIWPNHTVFIAHSFSEDIVARLRAKVLFNTSVAKNVAPAPDLSERVQSLPGFEALRAEAEREFIHQFIKPE
ncbi:MAG: hypothetical protein ACM3SW_04615 [Actinomycetota bacterium]